MNWKTIGIAFAVAMVALSGVVSAANTAPMTLTGEEVTESAEVTVAVGAAGSSFDDWSLSVGSNTYNGAATSATISANVGTGHDANLYAIETAAGANVLDGKMYSATADHALGLLKIDAITPAGANDITDLSTSKLLYKLASAGTQAVDFDFVQQVGYDDPAASNYGIIVTFTGLIEDEP